jgi:hypothetical protein
MPEEHPGTSTAVVSGGEGEAAAEDEDAHPELPPEEEEDPLVVAQRHQDAEERAKAEASEPVATDDPALKAGRALP